MYEHMGDILLALGDQAEALNYLAKAAIGYESQGKSEEKTKVEAKILRVSGLSKSSTRESNSPKPIKTDPNKQR